MSRAATLAVASRIADVTGASAELLQALAIGLDVLDRSVWPAVAWGFSRLTSSQYPVEFTFSTEADELRATLEVAGPETPQHLRLDAGLELAEMLDLPAPGAAEVRAWRALQAGAELRWGCWLSLRQTAHGFGGKLYIEAPRGRPAATEIACADAQLHMVGHDLRSGASEHYFMWPVITALECEHRLEALGVPDAAPLMVALEEVMGMPRLTGVPRARLGVSLADKGRGVALFLDPASVRGGAAAIRRRMTRPGSSYEGLLGSRAPQHLPDHGIVTLALRGQRVELRTGVAADGLA